MHKILNVSKPLGVLADVQRGITPFNLTERPTHKTSRLAFGGTVRRYILQLGKKVFVRFDDTLAEPKPEKYFIGPRILLRELISRKFQLQAVKVKVDFVTNKSMQSILQLRGGPGLSFLLGIINSNLLSWYFLHHSNIGQRDDFPKIVLKETRTLPIRVIDFDNPSDKARHDHIVSLVERMLAAKEELSKARTESETARLERECEALDRQIDQAVYELYGLTEEEIKVVEGK